MPNNLLVRDHYEVVFRDRNNETIYVDTQDKDDVYYMFHVYLMHPNVDIYVCFNDGSRKKIVLQEEEK